MPARVLRGSRCRRRQRLFATLVEHGLKVEGDVCIGLAEWNSDGWQSLAERKAVVLEGRRFPTPSDASCVGSPMTIRNPLERSGQDRFPVRFRSISTRLTPAWRSSSCFFTYMSRPGPAILLEGLMISITVTTRRPDLRSMISIKPLPHRLILIDLNDQWLGHGDPVTCQ